MHSETRYYLNDNLGKHALKNRILSSANNHSKTWYYPQEDLGKQAFKNKILF